MLKIKGEVIKVEKEDISVSTIVQGIKQGNPEPFGATAGSCGTYRIGYPTVSRHLFITISIFNSNSCEHQHIKIDVRESACNINGWKNLTESRVAQLRDKLIKKYVDVENNKEEWNFVDEKMIVNIKMPDRTPLYSEVFAPPQQFNTIIDYLKFRFTSIREYRDFFLTRCKKYDFERQQKIYQSFPFNDDYLNKPIGSEPVDSDYNENAKIIYGKDNKKIKIVKKVYKR
ncbi:MAG: hypothetical protein FWB95_04260 [Treponema sp.]|nr:hypothetical protein [Treponema sp.]